MKQHIINPASEEYIRSFGIRTDYIALDGYNSEGYWSFLKWFDPDAGGPRRIFDATGSARVWREWPEGFDVEEIRKDARECEGDGCRATACQEIKSGLDNDTETP